MDIVYSVNGVPIRLTDERWLHIVNNHTELAGYCDDILATIENPDFILQGYKKSLIAVRGISKNRYLAVIYKELRENDGFIISAYLTSKINRGAIIWPEKF